MKRWTPLHITLCSLMIALTAIGANITAIAPFLVVGGVPITLQTFFAIMAGLLLGSRLGALSMFVYMLLGLVGAPVFAHFKGGMASLLNPTFGFIISFVLVAYVAGKIIEVKKGRKFYVIAALTAMTINYIFGTNWMYLAYIFWFEAPEGTTYQLVWLWMIAPLPKDIILSIMAGIIAFRIERTLSITTKLQPKRNQRL